jgi:protein-S-isoprenylcysteine O-methyltransferase Ste14
MAISVQKPPRQSVRSRQNLVLFIPLVALLVVRLAARRYGPPSPADWALDGAGMLLILAGLWIRTCARQWKIERGNEELVTDGLYGYIRHPLYVGSWLLGTGICLVLGDPVVIAAFMVLFWLSHGLVICSEETGLAEIFGEQYRAYQREVPAFIPRLRSPALRVTPHRFGEGAAREGDAICIGLALALLIQLVQWTLGGRPESPLTAAGSVYPALLLFGLTALALLWLRLKLDYRVLAQQERRRSVNL